MLRRISAISSLGLALIPWNLAHAAGEVVRFGLYDNPPKLIWKEDGEATGLFPELIREVALRRGWEVEFLHATWPELLDALESGEIDVLPDVALSDERQARYIFNREPVLSAWSSLYVAKGRAKRIISEFDLDGMTIAAIPRSVQKNRLSEVLHSLQVEASFLPADSFEEALRYVESGIADAALLNTLIGTWLADDFPEIESTHLVINPVRLHFISMPGPAEQYLHSIDQLLSRWKSEPDSVYFALLDEWIRPVQEGKNDIAPYVPWLIIILILTILILITVRFQLLQRTRDLRSESRRNRLLDDALVESQQRLQLALEHSRVGLWDWDVKSGRIICNNELCRLFGWEERGNATLTRDNWLALIHDEDTQKVEEAIKGHLHGSTDLFQCEFRQRHADGYWIWILSRGRVVERSQQREPVRMIGTITDITDIKNSEEALRRARDEANSANEAKSRFLAMMSHELKTPLNAITGPTDILLLKDDDEDRREMLEVIRESSQNLLTLLNRILKMSELERESDNIELRPVELLPLFRYYLIQQIEAIRNKGLEFRETIQPGLPEAILSEQNLLQEVMINLLDNARKFTSAGEVHLMVEWKAEEDDPRRGRLVVRVADTGPGIPEETQEKIFKAFQQADMSLKREHGGSGLGLAISNLIMHRLNGELILESTGPQGSVFRVELDTQSASTTTP